MPDINNKIKLQPHDIDNQSIIKNFNKLHKTLTELQNDADVLCRFLAPALELRKQNDKFIETVITDIKAYTKTNKPNLIYIFGNNDLQQVEFIAQQYREFFSRDKNIPFIASGQGGHGTVYGPISKFSEAATFKRKLQECGIHNLILIEEKATNTGENISLSYPLLKGYEQQSAEQLSTIMLSSSFTNALRQIRSFAQQSKLDSWQTLFILPPNAQQLRKLYFANYLDASVNLLATLREVLSLIDFTIRTNFVLIKSFPDENTFIAAHQLAMHYLAKLLQKPKLEVTGKQHLAMFLEFIRLQESKSGENALPGLQASLINFYKPLADYLRISFELLERETMKNLSTNKSITTLHNQSLFFNKSYARIDVDPILDKSACHDKQFYP